MFIEPTKTLLRWIVVLSCFLIACEGEEALENCDFTEKLLNIAIDEKKELLQDTLALAGTLAELTAKVEEEERQRQEIENLVNAARPSGTPYHHQSLSKVGKIALVKKDLLEKLKNSKNLIKKQKWLTLYNHLRWGELITERAYLQRCDKRIVLQSESTPYRAGLIEANFLQGGVETIASKDLYYAYSTPAEMQYLNDSTNVFRFLGPKTGRGFSTGFFVEDVQQQTQWKVKVGWEAYREPLATRIAWALGFYVDEVFHVRELRVAFDGDLEKLFEAKDRKIEESLSGIVLKDGTWLNLISTPAKKVAGSALYQSYRNRIRYFVFKSVVLERRDANIVRANQWAFDALGNPDLRAVRMLGLLNFWMQNIDIKFDNNRIFLRCTDPAAQGKDVFQSCVESGNYAYQFVVHDLGLAFAPHPNKLNQGGFALDIRREPNGVASFRSNTRGRDIYAWHQSTREDAFTFSERLAQLTEKQLRQAVAAGGYPYPALVLIVEKLKFRRNQFLAALRDDRFVPFTVNLSLSNASSGKVVVGENERLTIPQDNFILSEGILTNDISLGNHGRHAEMIRQ